MNCFLKNNPSASAAPSPSFALSYGQSPNRTQCADLNPGQVCRVAIAASRAIRPPLKVCGTRSTSVDVMGAVKGNLGCSAAVFRLAAVIESGRSTIAAPDLSACPASDRPVVLLDVPPSSGGFAYSAAVVRLLVDQGGGYVMAGSGDVGGHRARGAQGKSGGDFHVLLQLSSLVTRGHSRALLNRAHESAHTADVDRVGPLQGSGVVPDGRPVFLNFDFHALSPRSAPPIYTGALGFSGLARLPRSLNPGATKDSAELIVFIRGPALWLRLDWLALRETAVLLQHGAEVGQPAEVVGQAVWRAGVRHARQCQDSAEYRLWSVAHFLSPGSRRRKSAAWVQYCNLIDMLSIGLQKQSHSRSATSCAVRSLGVSSPAASLPTDMSEMPSCRATARLDCARRAARSFRRQAAICGAVRVDRGLPRAQCPRPSSRLDFISASRPRVAEQFAGAVAAIHRAAKDLAKVPAEFRMASAAGDAVDPLFALHLASPAGSPKWPADVCNVRSMRLHVNRVAS